MTKSLHICFSGVSIKVNSVLNFLECYHGLLVCLEDFPERCGDVVKGVARVVEYKQLALLLVLKSAQWVTVDTLFLEVFKLQNWYN